MKSKQPRTNPFMPESFPEQMEHTLPSGHLAIEKQLLTQYQSVVFPMVCWLLDPQRHRAEGRSTLVAHVLIELAMRGYRVPVDDISRLLDNDGISGARRFIDQVMDIIHTQYPEHLFRLCEPRGYEMRLEYCGRRPR